MEIHLGVIRDKQAIYSALQQSQALNRQLAICFNSDGKLLVKICTVLDIVGEGDDANAIVRSPPQEDAVIPLNRIQSIYPIRDFL